MTFDARCVTYSTKDPSMNIEKTIRSRSTELTDYTAQNLSTIVQIPSLSGKEEAVICHCVTYPRTGHYSRVDAAGNGENYGCASPHRYRRTEQF